MMDKNLSGIHCVLYALFNKDGTLDKSAMEEQVRLLLAAGVDGMTILGLATEVQKLDANEQRQLINWVSRAVVGNSPFSVTISGNSIAEQRELAHYATDNGADWLILQPPMAGDYSGEVYLDFFIEVAKGFNVNFAIQNAPQYLGRALNNADVKRLRLANEHFSLIKAEVSAVALSGLVDAVGSNMTVLNGRGGLEMTDCLRAGVDGFVLAPDIADICKSIRDNWLAGDSDSADALYQHVLPAIVFSMQSLEHLICYGKRIFGHRAGIPIYDRSPALLPTDLGLELAANWAKQLGIFEG